jgi:mycofactocin precursor
MEVVMTPQAVIEPTPVQTGPTEDETVNSVSDRAEQEALVAEELLVEEVSIDGMCGVY